jgi:NAD(P)-dependent dehydrogenase (short-subunit alcohol dehydrogenase family)
MSRVVLITGASGGLGTEVTKAFLASGAQVIGTSRSIKQAEFPEANFNAVPADITKADEAVRVANSTREQFGRVDSLIHVMGGFAAGAVHETDATWARMRDLNLTAAFNIFRATLPIMREQRSGRIVAVGSLAAEEGVAGIAAYSAFKNALASLVKSIAAENNDHGITANIVLPGTM